MSDISSLRRSRMSSRQCLEHPWMAQHAESMSRVALPTDKLKKFIVRRKWQVNIIFNIRHSTFADSFFFFLTQPPNYHRKYIDLMISSFRRSINVNIEKFAGMCMLSSKNRRSLFLCAHDLDDS